ncbi:MAG: hypothetical protein HC929_08170 [Leptolyngbyaceae cyanobacterium SM2_5_2]|nr:hypothetical protein [Leptolyngbyaceae cyanobacterium SM2_5_2]
MSGRVGRVAEAAAGLKSSDFVVSEAILVDSVVITDEPLETGDEEAI